MDLADLSDRKLRRLARGVGLAIVAMGGLLAGRAHATEGGASLYLLGSGGPEAAVLPPLPGVYLDDTFYDYDGSAGGGKQFVVGGNVVANLHARIVADFATVVWVPTTNFVGGTTLEFGAILPMGEPTVDVSAILTGPLGRQLRLSKSESADLIGDPVAIAGLGWHSDNLYVAGNVVLNIPVGNYNPGHLANLAFHRWAGDTSVAATWHDPKSGWDVSGKAGFTFNGTNETDDYTSGTEFHIEGALEKALTPAWSVGAQVYYFDQVSGDSGAGAKLGPFEGRVAGAGGTVAYHFALGHTPMTLRGRIMSEFAAVNRLSGTSYWLDLSFPLVMKLPAGAPHE